MVAPEDRMNFELFTVDEFEIYIQKDLIEPETDFIEFLIPHVGTFIVEISDS